MPTSSSAAWSRSSSSPRSGGPGEGGDNNNCHFNSSAVSGMALAPHPTIDCTDGHPTNRAQIGAGSAAQGNLQAASLVMSRDYTTAPIYLRPDRREPPSDHLSEGRPRRRRDPSMGPEMIRGAEMIRALVSGSRSRSRASPSWRSCCSPVRPSPPTSRRPSHVSSSTPPRCARALASRTASSTPRQRGETLAIDGRLGGGFWLRILLPDGRVAYALGDEVQTFAVSAGEPDAPSRPGLFRDAAPRGRARGPRDRRRSPQHPDRRRHDEGLRLPRSAPFDRRASHRHPRRMDRRRADRRRRADPPTAAARPSTSRRPGRSARSSASAAGDSRSARTPTRSS